MPIIDACIVMPPEAQLPAGVAKLLAEAVAGVLDAKPGSVWVRVQCSPQHLYAENGEAEPVCPVFLKVLHADLPATERLAHEALALSKAVGTCLGRPPDLVHVEYAAAGRGRVAFGGLLPL